MRTSKNKGKKIQTYSGICCRAKVVYEKKVQELEGVWLGQKGWLVQGIR